jgi:hypothetical protein
MVQFGGFTLNLGNRGVQKTIDAPGTSVSYRAKRRLLLLLTLLAVDRLWWLD